MSSLGPRLGRFGQGVVPDLLRGGTPTRVMGVAVVGPVIALNVVGTSERELGAFVKFLDFYCGVFSLVALSITVMVGVLAMDRILLQPRHRLQAQMLHRAVAVASVGFLIIHVAIRVIERHVTPLDMVVPFMAQGRTFYVGLGTIAAYLMLLLAVTGVARGRFAQRTRPTLWRAIHALAYVAWPAALFHGLQAGRTPKTWVNLSYEACVALVVLALLIRTITSRRHKANSKRHGRATKNVRIPPAEVRRATGRRAKLEQAQREQAQAQRARAQRAAARPAVAARPAKFVPEYGEPKSGRPPTPPDRRGARVPDADRYFYDDVPRRRR
jgi:DMSO/TMAO reductase YedYZ heme-binding membrane subunit